MKKVNNNLKITDHETINNYTKSDHKMIKLNISLITSKSTKLIKNPKQNLVKKINLK